MAEFHKVLKADPLGEPWTPNKPGAKPIQNYWCQVEGQDKSVAIGRQTDNPLRPGMHVYGDLMYAKSQKGTEYWKFKGSKVPEGVARPTDDPSTPAQATAQQAVDMSGQVPGWAVPLYNMVEFIYKEMKAMSTTEEEPAVTTNEEHKGVEQIAGEPIDEETQSTLDAIFPPSDVPEEA